ncbi:MAG: DUF2971 domain-containing protein [Anaerotignum sp.]
MELFKKTGYIDKWVQIPLYESGKRLYHYTTAEGVQGIVENKQFIATKSNFLNDKLEFLYALDVLEKLIEIYVVDKELGRKLYQIVKDEMDELAIVKPSCDIACAPEKRQMSFYVVSFSKLENSALLWAEFTEFKGYCLGFDYEKIVEGFSNRSFLHGTVIYDERQQINCLLEALLSCIGRVKGEGHIDLETFFDEVSYIDEESLHKIGKDMAMVCSVYAMFFKSQHFDGEEEYRFIFSPSADEAANKPRFRILGEVFLPFIMVEFDGKDKPIPLETVMVGAKNNNDITIRGVRAFLRAQGLNIPVTLSDIPLRY